MNNPNGNLNKINPKMIATECSPKHIQSVIEDLLELAIEGHRLATSISKLNPQCNEIGEGRLRTMIDDANSIINKTYKD